MLTVKKLQDNIRNEIIAPIYVVLGLEQYQAKRGQKMLEQSITDDEQVMNYASYDMTEIPLATALDDAMTVPFFGDRRVVVIENPLFLTGQKSATKIDHDVDSLMQYLDQPQPTTTLVFMAPYEKLDARKKVVKKLKQVAEIVDVSPMTESQVRQVVNEQLSGDGYRISASAMDELIHRTNAKLSTIMDNLQKLELFNLETKIVDEVAIDGLIEPTLDENVFDLIASVLAGKDQQAIEQYHDLIANEEQPLRINAALIGQIRVLLQTKLQVAQGLNQAEIASRLKIHPYRVKLAIQDVQKFSLDYLSGVYQGLFEIERQLKSSTRDPELLFELFVLKFK